MSLAGFLDELVAYLESFWATFVAWLESVLGFPI